MEIKKVCKVLKNRKSAFDLPQPADIGEQTQSIDIVSFIFYWVKSYDLNWTDSMWQQKDVKIQSDI